MAQQVKSLTSESLEAAYRALTPSQEGFTEDLMASNTIIPVLDLTASAEGTSTPSYLTQALAFGSQTAFDVRNSSTVIANTPGFYRIFGSVTVQENASAPNCRFDMSDGLSTKTIIKWQQADSGSTRIFAESFDFIVFLATGISITAVSNSLPAFVAGSIRQIANVSGEIVNPSGFTPQ